MADYGYDEDDDDDSPYRDFDPPYMACDSPNSDTDSNVGVVEEDEDEDDNLLWLNETHMEALMEYKRMEENQQRLEEIRQASF